MQDAGVTIHGYVYPVAERLPETFFLRGADCWVWATWARAWQHFRADGAALLAELVERRLTRSFDFDGAFSYTRMLEDQIAGRNNSWAVRWHASCFLADRLTLYPGVSLVHCIGNDSSGTHCGTTHAFSVEVADRRTKVGGIPVEPSKAGRDALIRFFRDQRSLRARAARWLERKLGSAA